MPLELADNKIESLEWGEILGFKEKENVLSLRLQDNTKSVKIITTIHELEDRVLSNRKRLRMKEIA